MVVTSLITGLLFLFFLVIHSLLFQYVLHRREPGGVSPPWKCLLRQLSVQHLLHSRILCEDLL